MGYEDISMIPDPELIEYVSLIPKGPVLDLGIGNGRNAFFLAQKGFEVLGVDISEDSVNKCNKKAQELKLPVKAVRADVTDLKIQENTYACIVCSYVLLFLRRSEALLLIKRIKHGLMPHGIAFIKTFTVKDPLFNKLRNRGLPEVEKNTFFSPKFQSYFFFLQPNELKGFFTDFKLISYAEGYSLDITHDEPHYHGWASMVTMKPER